MLVHNLQHVVLLFLVKLLREDNLLVVLYRVIYALGRFLGLLYLLEDFLHLLLHSVNIDVTNDDDTLEIGTIPLFVVVAQSLIWEVIDNLHYTYRQAAAISVAWEDVGKHALLHTHHGAVASAPLLVDDTALAVDLLFIKCKTVGPVVQNPKA